MARIGIYAGTFNPVHAGHVAFALQAMAAADLQKVYFLPERRPRHKKSVEHFGHRVAMLRRASQPHPDFGIIELPDLSFTVKRTLPQLQVQFPDDELVFLMGSDTAGMVSDWPHVEKMINQCEFVVGLRQQDSADVLHDKIAEWPIEPKGVTMFTSHAADVSSSNIREALYSRKTAKGLLSSVAKYSDQNWLYVSVNSD